MDGRFRVFSYPASTVLVGNGSESPHKMNYGLLGLREYIPIERAAVRGFGQPPSQGKLADRLSLN